MHIQIKSEKFSWNSSQKCCGRIGKTDVYSNVFTQSVLHSVCNNTGSPQDVKSSRHLASLSGNQISDSFKSIILCIGRLSLRSPSFWVFPTNNLTLRTKPSASEFMPTTFATGHWLWSASVFSKTISPFWKFLCFSFHLWWGWSDHRNSFCHLTQNSLAICCICLYLFLLYSSSSTKWPGGGKTTLDFMVKMLLGHIGCLLCTSPNISTIKGLEFTIASVSSRIALSDSSFRDLLCVCNKDISIVCANRICLSQTPLIWLDAGGFLWQLM